MLSFNVENVHQYVQRKVVHMHNATVGVYDNGRGIATLIVGPLFDTDAVIRDGTYKPEHMTCIEITLLVEGRGNSFPPTKIVPLLVTRDSLMAEIGFLIAKNLD